MLWGLFLIPFVSAILALIIRNDKLRHLILAFAAVAHFILTTSAWFISPKPLFSGWLELDSTGRLFLSVTSVLFLAAAFYAIGYLRNEKIREKEDFEEGALFSNAPDAIFVCCMLSFLGTMTFLTLSQHFSLMWVAMEATTLVSAPLIYFHRHHRSLEATWKYLLICSVGIAIALLGNFFLAAAASVPGGKPVVLMVSELIKNADKLNIVWVKTAFIFILVGYGTKMGLAPLHTWLPDAHSEAPSVISSLLSGAMLNCAFLGILRALQVCNAAGLADFAKNLLIIFGLFSMICAAVFIIGQTDYKRMLAYSSVEHMGILSFGVGLGKAAVFGSMLHLVNHSLTKAALFLVAGNILTVYKTKNVKDVQGMLKVMPKTGILWFAGILAITGFPPFGMFISEFTILRSGFEQGRPYVTLTYLALLIVIFVGIISICLKMAQGTPAAPLEQQKKSERFLAIVPPAILACIVLMLGLFIPPALDTLLHEVSAVLGGS